MSKEKTVFIAEDLDEHTELIDEEVDTVNIPTCKDPEWSDYVLTLFADDEKFNGNPTVDGMRRVAESLIGEIVAIRTQVIQAPTPENDKRATVICSVTFLDSNDILKEYSGAADVCWINCDKPFYKYPVSTAETRAEGRALKRALKLKKISVAEELSNVALTDDIIEETNEKITQTQINFIEILCKNDSRGLNINIQKLVQKLYEKVYNINELKHSESLQIQEKLSEYQQDKTKIPSEIVGYDVMWKSTFCK